jgi:hypothetical protein
MAKTEPKDGLTAIAKIAWVEIGKLSIPNIRPIKILDTRVPQKFQITSYFHSLRKIPYSFWSVELVIEITEQEIPQSIEVNVKGEVRRMPTSRVPSKNSSRVEKSQLLALSRDIRELDALATRIVAMNLHYNFENLEFHEWVHDPTAPPGEEEIRIEETQLRAIEKEILSRITYSELTTDFLRLVSKWYREEEKLADEEGRNPKTSRYIQEKYYELYGGKERSVRTIEKWVSIARHKFGFLEKLPEPSPKKKAMPVNKKQPTAKGKS